MHSTAEREWAPASPCAAAAVFFSLLWLLPGGVNPALAQSDPTGSAPRPEAATEGGGAGPARPSAARGVRPLDAVARSAVRRGAEGSPTFRRLLEALEGSDLVVYVRTGFVHGPGRLDFACAKAGTRYLHITVDVPAPEARLVAALAHELQHAVEIAGAPDVLDRASVARYYRRHGQRLSCDAFCTREAQRTTEAVLYEFAAAARK